MDLRTGIAWLLGCPASLTYRVAPGPAALAALANNAAGGALNNPLHLAVTGRAGRRDGVVWFMCDVDGGAGH